MNNEPQELELNVWAGGWDAGVRALRDTLSEQYPHLAEIVAEAAETIALTPALMEVEEARA